MNLLQKIVTLLLIVMANNSCAMSIESIQQKSYDLFSSPINFTDKTEFEKFKNKATEIISEINQQWDTDNQEVKKELASTYKKISFLFAMAVGIYRFYREYESGETAITIILPPVTPDETDYKILGVEETKKLIAHINNQLTFIKEILVQDLPTIYNLKLATPRPGQLFMDRATILNNYFYILIGYLALKSLYFYEKIELQQKVVQMLDTRIKNSMNSILSSTLLSKNIDNAITILSTVEEKTTLHQQKITDNLAQLHNELLTLIHHSV